jgi:hypothetical protein
MLGYYDRLIAMSAEGKPLSEPLEDPTRKVTSGSMLDLALFQSPVIGFYGSALGVRNLRPGCRFQERTRLSGCLHHLLFYGEAQGWDHTGFAAR